MTKTRWHYTPLKGLYPSITCLLIREDDLVRDVQYSLGSGGIIDDHLGSTRRTISRPSQPTTSRKFELELATTRDQ